MKKARRYIQQHSDLFRATVVVSGLLLTRLLPETQSIFAAVTWLTCCAVFWAPRRIKSLFDDINTYHHEAGHALAAIISSGRCDGFAIQKTGNTAGHCTVSGGNDGLILAAGHTFGSILGGIYISRSVFGNIMPIELLVLGLLYLLSLVKAKNAYTILIGIGLVMLLSVPAFLGNQFLMRTVLNALGVLLILMELRAQLISHLISVNENRPTSDAARLREYYKWGHPLFWSLLFSGVTAVVIFAVASVAFRV